MGSGHQANEQWNDSLRRLCGLLRQFFARSLGKIPFLIHYIGYHLFDHFSRFTVFPRLDIVSTGILFPDPKHRGYFLQFPNISSCGSTYRRSRFRWPIGQSCSGPNTDSSNALPRPTAYLGRPNIRVPSRSKTAADLARIILNL